MDRRFESFDSHGSDFQSTRLKEKRIRIQNLRAHQVTHSMLAITKKGTYLVRSHVGSNVTSVKILTLHNYVPIETLPLKGTEEESQVELEREVHEPKIGTSDEECDGTDNCFETQLLMNKNFGVFQVLSFVL